MKVFLGLELSLQVARTFVLLENGLVRLTILKPQGYLIGIKYGGMDNVLDLSLSKSSRGYWDINWSWPGGPDTYQLLSGSDYKVISSNNDHVEVSFSRIFDPSTQSIKLPLSVDIRYILRSGVSGFYCYAIYQHPAGSHSFEFSQTRMVFKLRRDKFHYMAISNEKQRIMPMPEDLHPDRSKQLIVPESVLLVNPINSDLKGEVDDRYQYSVANKDGGVHGWIGSNPVIGFWTIFPSQEFRNGGPTKQNLTVHTGPTTLAMFHGTHYIGDDIVAQFQPGEEWRKVFGPIFVYLNSTPYVSEANKLWSDAKKRRLLEIAAWPYDFVSSPYYLKAEKRGSITGRLFVQDRFVSTYLIPAKHAHIGVTVARTEGGWQTESKDYQFWVQTDAIGKFTINNVVPGVYGIHGWVPGFIGDFLNKELVTISAGLETQVGNLIYVPPRDGPTLWEIGFPDRTANGYYVPEVEPMYLNRLFINSPEKYRQYGLWDRYTDIHSTSDQTFIVGVSNPKKDWFFAHVSRKWAENIYVPSTWSIKFTIDSVASGTYKLRLAIASATRSDIKIYINGVHPSRLVFEAKNLGTDNTVLRHGIHGLYRLITIDVSSLLLVEGDNSMFLVQARSGDPVCGVLYDYMRLEAPSSSGNCEHSEEGFDLDAKLL
ncbi:hypothetical protein K2173_004677 [Erythroxylum novogranatense]|uniref:rhamnogalacturonan endolyase n=1 Tax=Erythroxylum novogranatense TaxID=1862640 RepID=A0AAV8T6K1_9ROSI|nr:hypothetical protein K2173_004677 [Erythroxylum novogranatense]